MFLPFPPARAPRHLKRTLMLRHAASCRRFSRRGNTNIAGHCSPPFKSLLDWDHADSVGLIPEVGLDAGQFTVTRTGPAFSATTRVIGYAADKLLGQPVQDPANPEDLAQLDLRRTGRAWLNPSKRGSDILVLRPDKWKKSEPPHAVCYFSNRFLNTCTDRRSRNCYSWRIPR